MFYFFTNIFQPKVHFFRKFSEIQGRIFSIELNYFDFFDQFSTGVRPLHVLKEPFTRNHWLISAEIRLLRTFGRLVPDFVKLVCAVTTWDPYFCLYLKRALNPTFWQVVISRFFHTFSSFRVVVCGAPVFSHLSPQNDRWLVITDPPWRKATLILTHALPVESIRKSEKNIADWSGFGLSRHPLNLPY